MQISSADRSVAVVVRADAATAAAVAGGAKTGPAASASATAAEPVRAGITQPRAESGDYLSARQGARGPDTPSADADNRDWASSAAAEAAQKKAEQKQEATPRLYEMLIEQFNSLWRASAQAVDASTQTQALAQANRQSQIDNAGKRAPLVYTDPSKVRKSGSADGA